MANLAGEREYFCALARLGTDSCIPGTASADNRRNVRVSLDVVDQCRLSQQALHRGIRRTWTRSAALAFDRRYQRCFFAADIGTGSNPDLDSEAKGGAADVRTQESELLSLGYGGAQSASGQRIFSSDINVALRCANRE